MVSLERGHIRAPELFGDFWFNAESISIRAMRGSVFLINFWDYSSVGCIRSQPYVKEWSARYKDFDFLVVGVHTPRYKFGKDPGNIEKAIRHAGIEYPVVMDNDAVVWGAYGSRIWPTRFLVDKDGFLRCFQEGDGSYDKFEHALQSLLVERGFHGLLPELMEPLRCTDYPGAICFRPTQEIQLGYLRGTIGNPEGYAPESTIEYADTGFLLPGRVYLKGKWCNERESVRFDGVLHDEGNISIEYEAAEVNSVMDSPRKTPCRILIYQDKEPLTRDNAGVDVAFDAQNRSYILVDGPRMFNIVCNREFGRHELTLITSAPGLALYSLSFVTTVIPELVSQN